jgi:nicotinate-nucleotide--dimethylbenzimidazole phosphoribosyltransferase
MFSSIDELRAACRALPQADAATFTAARARQAALTKPPGSPGRLEEIAAWLAGWQRTVVPRLERVEVVVFAGSHGVTAQGVSAYPPAVTGQMVANFAAGGAAINQLARTFGAGLAVRDVGVERPTADFTEAPAMDHKAFVAAAAAGAAAVPDGIDILCLGEMGIGNTTSAAAVCAALFGGGGAWAGRGTGVDDAGLARKRSAVERALARHRDAAADPLAALAALGGRELAAIFGAVLAARLKRVPVLLDGFVCTAAAAPLARLHPNGLAHALAGHVSAEGGHRRLLDELGLAPLLDLGMRLGEASGACLAVGIVRAAAACHAGMTTFAEAGVSEA